MWLNKPVNFHQFTSLNNYLKAFILCQNVSFLQSLLKFSKCQNILTFIYFFSLSLIKGTCSYKSGLTSEHRFLQHSEATMKKTTH